jgi:glycosyltransferase involved in cell wall biosynthesis
VISRDCSVSVVVPVFNEAKTLVAFLSRLESTALVHFSNFEVIVVSDGSTDDSVCVARAFGRDWLKVIEISENLGKGGALKEGFRSCSGSLVAFLDGDLDIHPSCLPVLVNMLDFQLADGVVGSKSHPNSVVSYPMMRRVQSRAFSLIVRRFFSLNVRDTQTGVKVFRREALQEHLHNVTVSGFAFDLELLARMSRSGMKIVEGPIEIDYQFDSRVSIKEPVRMVMDILRIWRSLK